MVRDEFDPTSIGFGREAADDEPFGESVGWKPVNYLLEAAFPLSGRLNGTGVMRHPLPSPPPEHR